MGRPESDIREERAARVVTATQADSHSGKERPHS